MGTNLGACSARTVCVSRRPMIRYGMGANGTHGRIEDRMRCVLEEFEEATVIIPEGQKIPGHDRFCLAYQQQTTSFIEEDCFQWCATLT